MYEKPELAVVGPINGVVLGPDDDQSDNEVLPFIEVEGIAYGLDE